MAGAKEIKKRIVSVKNTRKITKTMEMVATSKSKRMIDRVNAAKPYGEKLLNIMDTLSNQGGAIESPYLRKVDNVKRVAVIVLSSNRGLCGGFNTNVLKMARNRIREHREAGHEVYLHVIGKKGINYFKFLKIEMDLSTPTSEDKIQFEEADAIAQQYMDRFRNKEFDSVEFVSNLYQSSASQKPGITQVLPLGKQEHHEKKGIASGKVNMDITFDPEPEIILKNLIPHVIKANIYRLMLESAAAEQIYRRIAMKSANDAAKEMEKFLNRTYNRIRQASITQEISEIVAGSDAVS